MQAAAAAARQGERVVYVSGEEAVAQITLRAGAWGSPTRRSNSLRKPRSRTCSPPSTTGRRRGS